MNVIFNLIIAAEIVFIVYIGFSKCAKSIQSTKVTLLLLVAYSIPVFFIMYILITYFELGGTGIFIFATIAYIVPIKLLFKGSFINNLSTDMICLNYAMLIYCLSVQITNIFNVIELNIARLVIQTALFIITMPFYLHFISRMLLKIKNHSNNKITKRILALSSASVITLVLINFAYVFNVDSVKILSLLTLFSCSVMSYILLYYFIINYQSITNLRKIIYKDTLVDIKNRACVFKDIQLLMDCKNPFNLIYMDLDNFKLVNDKYGHQCGDEYLLEFVRLICEDTYLCSRLYRMSGDEFIIVSEDLNIAVYDIMNNINKRLDGFKIRGCAFKGVSYGYASYPIQGDTLDKIISIADSKMYDNKNSKIKEDVTEQIKSKV
ncbi:MAG: GGDEF domain-containing protein [Erysipelotrichaceae bacterium]